MNSLFFFTSLLLFLARCKPENEPIHIADSNLPTHIYPYGKHAGYMYLRFIVHVLNLVCRLGLSLPNPAPDVELEGPEPHLNIHPPLPHSGKNILEVICFRHVVQMNYVNSVTPLSQNCVMKQENGIYPVSSIYYCLHTYI